MNQRRNLFHLVFSQYRVQHVFVLFQVTALNSKVRDPVVGTFHDLLLQHRSVTGDDEHGRFLIFPVERIDRLRGNKLENDGIHRSFESEQKTCSRKNHHIDTENKIPGRFVQSG